MMETASLILAIVTIGKYQEGKAKQSILEMADELFPEEVLLANTTVSLLSIKNQNFDVLSQQTVEVSFLDEDDIILITAPFRLLNDVTVLSIPKSTPPNLPRASD